MPISHPPLQPPFWTSKWPPFSLYIVLYLQLWAKEGYNGGNIHVCDTRDSIKTIAYIVAMLVQPPSWISKWPPYLIHSIVWYVSILDSGGFSCKHRLHGLNTSIWGELILKEVRYHFLNHVFSRHFEFQNGCHLYYIHQLSYISVSDQCRRLKMVAIPMFAIPGIPIKPLH